MKVGIRGFFISAGGTALGFLGWGLEQRWIMLVGWLVTGIGIIVGFIGIISHALETFRFLGRPK